MINMIGYQSNAALNLLMKKGNLDKRLFDSVLKTLRTTGIHLFDITLPRYTSAILHKSDYPIREVLLDGVSTENFFL